MKKRILSLLLAVLMTVSLLPASALAKNDFIEEEIEFTGETIGEPEEEVLGEPEEEVIGEPEEEVIVEPRPEMEPVGGTPVPYQAYNSETKTFSTASCTEYTVVTKDTTTFENGKWYVVNSNVTFEEYTNITVSGTANLILCDGWTLNVTSPDEYDAAVQVVSGNALNIYGQTAGTGTLVATGGSLSAGIGSNPDDESNSGTVIINGGTVKATGGESGAGIGGGDSNFGKNITINGGTVIATGGENGSCGGGAGIGGGDGAGGENITINGGTVIATGGNGLKSGGGAGIGGGYGFHGKFITINGGIVTAIGGDGEQGCGAGIGTGSGNTESSDIKVAADLTVKADDNNPPTTEITHTSVQDIASSLTGKKYVKIEKAAGPVSYQAYDSSTKTFSTASCTDYTVVTKDTTTFEDGKWYVVNSEVTFDSGTNITVSGTANLILCDGATLTVTDPWDVAAVNVAEGKTLNIYGQTLGTGTLVATTGSGNCAGIGGGDRQNGGTVTVNGGIVIATGGDQGAGIGGGCGGDGGTVTVNGGTVTATSGYFGTGIGGGKNGGGGIVTINGGTVTAKGGDEAAGIGHGEGNNDGTVTINGGIVIATGGENGAGIGGGHGAGGVTVIINGGIITATGNGGAGIGKGKDADGEGTLTVASGMTIKAGADAATAAKKNYTSGQDCVDVLQCAAYVKVYTPVSYQDYDSSNKKFETKSCDAYTVVTSSTTAWAAGWYVVNSDVTISDRVTLSGDVNLILCDGAKLTVQAQNEDGTGKGFAIAGYPYSLTVYGQSGGTGKLIALGGDGADKNYGGYGISCGTVTVNGGSVSATGGAGNGDCWGGTGIYGDQVTVNGGALTATGGVRGSSNCGGYGIYGPLTVNGGSVTVTGSNGATSGDNKSAFTPTSSVNVSAGMTVKAGADAATAAEKTYTPGQDCASVLSGEVYVSVTPPSPVSYQAYDSSAKTFSTASCTEYTVVTKDTTTFEDGKWYVVNSDVTFDSGKYIDVKGTANLILVDGYTLAVTTPGDSNAAIHAIPDRTLNIYGQTEGTGTLVATGGNLSAGIGGECGSSGGTITVNGGTVIATGGDVSAGIGGSCGAKGGTVTINGGTVTAIGGTGGGAGIGGDSGQNGTLTVASGLAIKAGASAGAAETKTADQALGQAYVRIYTPQTPVSYQAYDSSTKKFSEAFCDEYTVVESSTAAVTWTSGWYVVNSDVTISNTSTHGVSYSGDVRLILCDGATLTMTAQANDCAGIQSLYATDKLTIYGQSSGTGKLISTGKGARSGMWIAGTFTVNGGVVEASSNEDCGIFAPAFTINGGSVKALGGSAYGESYAGINGNSNAITVNGGTVTSIGGSDEWFSTTKFVIASGYVYKQADSEEALATAAAVPGTGAEVTANQRVVKVEKAPPVAFVDLNGSGTFDDASETKYDTLQDAIDAAETEGSVVLLSNVTNSGTLNCSVWVPLTESCGLTNAASATLVWDLSNGLDCYGCIGSFRYYANSGAQKIKVAEDQDTGDYVIATGIGSDYADKSTFKLTGVAGIDDVEITVGGSKVAYNGALYQLTVNNKNTDDKNDDEVVLRVEEPDYLTFTGTGAFTVALKKNNVPNGISLEYKNGSADWASYPIAEKIAVEEGASVKFRAKGTNATFSTGLTKYYQFDFTGTAEGVTVAASGNIMSLLDATCLCAEVPKYAFTTLFAGCNILTTAPELPATTLNAYCYRGMFNNCAALTEAPKLEATELKDSCYNTMFYGCSKLLVTVGTAEDYTWKIPHIGAATDPVSYMTNNCAAGSVTVATAANAGEYNYYKVTKATPAAFVDLNGNGTFDEADETKYDTVQDAVDAAVAAQGVTNLATAKTVKLLRDETVEITDSETAAVTVSEGKFVILDLDGHTFAATATVYSLTMIKIDGTLSIVDSSTEKSGKLAAFGGSAVWYLTAIRTTQTGTLLVSDIAISATGASTMNSALAIEGRSVACSGCMISGGVVETSEGGTLTMDAACRFASHEFCNYKYAILIDMTGATADVVKLIDYTGTDTPDYGTAGTSYKFVTDKDNGYVLKVIDNDLCAVKPVSYQDYNASTGKLETKSCDAYTVVTKDTTIFADGKWYVVNSDVTFASGKNITVNGTAHLILCDGASLTVTSPGKSIAAIRVAEGSALNIYGQSESTGALTATGGLGATGSEGGAGIGGSYNGHGGSVIINGGSVTATGSDGGAGIGGGDGGNGGSVRINGGTVTATGISGIGGGFQSGNGALTVADRMAIKAGANAATAVGKTAAQALGLAYVHIEKAPPVAFVDLNGSGTFDEATETKYDTVQAAINAAAAAQGVTGMDNAKTVKLLRDAKGDVTVAGGTFVKLDLAGYTLTGTGNGSVITNKGTLTVKDSDKNATHTGKFADYTGGIIAMDVTFTEGSTGGHYQVIYNEKKLTIDGGTIVMNATGGENYTYCVRGKGDGNECEIKSGTFEVKSVGGLAVPLYAYKGKLTVSGGTVNANNENGGAGGIFTNNNAELVITGGKITAISKNEEADGICVSSGTATISGCEVKAEGKTEAYGIYSIAAVEVKGGTYSAATIAEGTGIASGLRNKGGTAKVYNSEFTATGYTAYGIYQEGTTTVGGSLKATGEAGIYLPDGKTIILGTMTETNEGNNVPVPAWTTAIGITTEVKPTAYSPIAITTNGTAADVSRFTPDDESYVKFVTDHLEVALCEAKIGKIFYNTLAEAIAVAEADSTVKIMVNLLLTETIVVDKSITLDIGKHRVDTSADTAILVTGGKVTLSGGIVTGKCKAVAATGKDTEVILNGNGKYRNDSTGNVTVLHAVNDAVIEINGANIIGKSADGEKTAKVFYSGVNFEDNSNSETPGLIRVIDGTFSGRLSTSNWGRYKITGGTFNTNEVQNYTNPVDQDGKPTGTSVQNKEAPTVTLDDSGMLPYAYTAQLVEGATTYYKVVKQATYGVSISANALAGLFYTDRASYVAGDTVVVHCDCNAYYEVASVSMQPESEEAVTITAVDGKYSFKMPEKDVQITVTVKAKAAKGTFGSAITNEINAFGDFVSPAAVEAALEELLNNKSAANLKLFYKDGLDFDTFGLKKVADFLTELVGSGTVKQELLQHFPECQREDCEKIFLAMTESDVVRDIPAKLNEALQTKDIKTVMATVMKYYPQFRDEYRKYADELSAELPFDVFLGTLMNDFSLDLAQCVVINFMAAGDAFVDNASTDYMACVLNSDVIFDACAKMLEALQTGNSQTINSTLMSLYPSFREEIQKANSLPDAATADITLAKLVARLNDGKAGKVATTNALICDKVYRLMKNTAMSFTEDECKAAYNEAVAVLNAAYTAKPTTNISEAISAYISSVEQPGRQDALVALMLMADCYDYALLSGASESSRGEVVMATIRSNAVFMEKMAAIARAEDDAALVKALFTDGVCNQWCDEAGRCSGVTGLEGILTLLKRPVDLTVTGNKDNAFAWTGEAFDTANLTVVAKLNGTPVTDVSGYDYTFYLASDESMETPIEAPVKVGAYQVVVSVSEDDDNYLGTAEAYTFLIKPVIKQVNGSTNPGSNVNFTQLKDTTLTIYSSAEFEDFLEVRVSVNGGKAQVLDKKNYDAAQGSIKVTLKESYLKSLTPGTYVFSVVSGVKLGADEWLELKGERVEFTASQTVTIVPNLKMTISGDTTLKLSDVKEYSVQISGTRPENTRVVWSVSGGLYQFIGGSEGETVTILFSSVGTVTVTAKLVDSKGQTVKDAEGNPVQITRNVTVQAGHGTIIDAIVKAVKTVVTTVVKTVTKLFRR